MRTQSQLSAGAAGATQGHANAAYAMEPHTGRTELTVWVSGPLRKHHGDHSLVFTGAAPTDHAHSGVFHTNGSNPVQVSPVQSSQDQTALIKSRGRAENIK